MTTPTPLTRQRQLVRDFLAASQQRSQRESAAQQQFAAGEKAANEQLATSERAAQQQYATLEKSAEQQHVAAAKQRADEKSGHQRQLDGAASAIGEARRLAFADLSELGVLDADLPPNLQQATPQAPAAGATAEPLPQFLSSAARIGALQQMATQMLVDQRRQQARRRTMLSLAAIAAVILVVAGVFLYRQWSYDQKLAGLYNAGATALEAGEWQAAREQFTELLRLEPGYQDAQTLINKTYQAEQKTDVNPVGGAVYVYVPAGDFLMGSPEGVGNDNERPQHTVHLDAYWIAQTEVTNAQYAQCVTAGACSAPNNNFWKDTAKTDHPVTHVTWQQATDYAAWAGGRLPTEAEWEKAARGTDGRTYPWGEDPPDQNKANCCGFVNDTTPVGRYPDGVSPYGAADMAGNVWEWTADWYDSSYYGQSPAQNPTGPTSGDYRVVRGGSWYSDPQYVSVSARFDVGSGDDAYGFRVVCAASP